MQAITTGSAPTQAELWGARADDWAEIQEPAQAALYPPVLDRLAPAAGAKILDAGCASGVFAAEAVSRGLDVTGFDATRELIELARRRVPEARFDVGELEALPYDDDSFDVVTGFNSFQYAASPVNALREAARVTRPGGRVVALVWGAPEKCEGAPYIAALGSLLPPPPPGAPGPFALSVDGVLAQLLAEAGLDPIETGDIDAAWEYADEETLVRGLLSSGPAVRAIEHAGEQAVRAACLEAVAPCRTATGGARIENRWRYVIAEPLAQPPKVSAPSNAR